MQLFNQFIKDVTELRPYRYGNNVKLAVKRHLDDIEKSKLNDWPYYFDEYEASEKIEKFKKLRHTKGSFAGKYFDVQPGQAFTFGSIFGWRRKSNPKLRRFSKMYKATAKKSGKSEEMAAMEILFAFFNNEIGGEIYSLATKKDQANHIFKAVRRMCTMMRADSEHMRGRIKILQYTVEDSETGTIIGRLTADPESEDGASPSCSVVDEYHAHKTSAVLQGQVMGALEREDSLIAIITTAGHNKNFPCFDLQTKVCIPILKGNIINDEFFILIFDMDEGDDPHDENNWYKANPNLGNTPKLEAFRSVYNSAKIEGATAWSSFMTKCLNKWMDTPNVWIQSELWNKCANPKIKLEDYRKYDVVLGLDLSTRRDISALYILIPPQGTLTKFLAIPYFFCPEDKIKGVQAIDQVDYRQFKEDKEIIITTGKKGINYKFIEKTIKDLDKFFNIITVAYDPYNAGTLIDDLESYGLDCLEYMQTTSWMHAPTKKLELMVIEEEIEHTGNKCMNWMIGNVVLMTDTNGNVKINKLKSISKVDGPVSLAIAIGGYLTRYADVGELSENDFSYLNNEGNDIEGQEETLTEDDFGWVK